MLPSALTSAPERTTSIMANACLQGETKLSAALQTHFGRSSESLWMFPDYAQPGRGAIFDEASEGVVLVTAKDASSNLAIRALENSGIWGPNRHRTIDVLIAVAATQATQQLHNRKHS
jgi:hypothetical protein